MSIREFSGSEFNGKMIVFIADNAEKANPIEYYKKLIIEKEVYLIESVVKKDFESKGIKISKSIISNICSQRWKNFKKSVLDSEFDPKFEKLLLTTRKKDAKHLLKNTQLTSLGLTKFIFFCFLEYNYSFTTFRSEHITKEYVGKKLPDLIHLNNGKIEKTGETKLRDGELKHIVEFQNVTIVKFLECGEKWHCFFTTYKSLKGKESWEGGTPHIYYISHLFGHNKDYVVKQLKSNDYSLGNLPHIKYELEK